MVLNMGGLFPEQKPDINDDGYMSVIDNLTRADVDSQGFMSVSNENNIATTSVITGELDEGVIANMWDFEDTTYLGIAENAAGAGTEYITFDMLKNKINVVLNMYYSAYASGDSATATIQSSVDGLAWTDLDSQAGGSTEAKKNFSVQFSGRYLRLKFAYPSGRSCKAKIYSIDIRKPIL